MRKGDEHPEITEFAHICAVSPDAEGTKEICDILNATTVVTVSKSKKKKIKKDKELDKDLKDTFPASDPITHY
jgi:hypothetical protein